MSRDPATRRLVPRFRCMVRSWERGDEVVASGPRSGARRADRAPTCFGAFRAVTSRRGTCAAPCHADCREPAAKTGSVEPPDAIGRCLQDRSKRATPSIGQMTAICRLPRGRRARSCEIRQRKASRLPTRQSASGAIAPDAPHRRMFAISTPFRHTPKKPSPRGNASIDTPQAPSPGEQSARPL
jgi:hypothetical protein